MIKSKILLILLVFFNTYARSQTIETKQDFGTWLGFRLEKDLPKKFDISLEQQVRTWRNTTRIDQYLVDAGVKYSINKNFALNGNVRYIHDTNKFKNPENNFRYNLGIQLKFKVAKKLNLSFSNKYQQKFIYNVKSLNAERVSTLRHKIKLQLKYKKKHKFYFGTELFIRSSLVRDPHFHKQRFNLGDKIKTKSGEFNTGIGYEFSVATAEFRSLFFIKLIYTIRL